MMDTSIVRLKNVKGHCLVTTTDFFFPLVEDPYLMGRIACANVLSDMYAEGVLICDNMLMILAASLDMPEEYRDIVTWKLIAGFKSLADEAGTSVTGGQSVFNPWAVIGGVAQAVVPEHGVLMPTRAVPGDLLVLTKPLGTQVAVNLFQWLETDHPRWSIASEVIEKEDVKWAYDVAASSMERLNRVAASLMWKHGAHAATDVTGFGILGHAQNLVGNQRERVSFEIDCLPIIRGMASVDQTVNNMFQLVAGKSAETSGGLLICLPSTAAESYCKDIHEEEGWPAFVIGWVKEGERRATISPNVSIKEVS